MDKDKDLECKFEIQGEELPNPDKWPKSSKIVLGIIISIAIILLAGLIFLIIYYHKQLSKNSSESGDNDKQTPTQTPTPSGLDSYSFFGNISYHLNYDENGKIENSFKSDGYNHIKGIDTINNNKDYEKNERNIYNLYIPQFALDRKKDYNGVFLWIHGGAWTEGNLEIMDIFCKLIGSQGYISASLGYTLLTNKFKEFNIFKNLDEITACIKAIKNKLINLGFDGDKLYLAIGGYSSGAHLSLLYSYLNSKIDIIPLKYIVDFVGPIGLYPKYYYKIKSINETLPNIEDVSTIEQAVNNGKLVGIYHEDFAANLMNLFSGNKFNDSLDEMIFPNKSINYENDKFKEMLNIVKNAFVTDIEDKNRIPTLCIYGGTDDVVGVTTYAYLKQKMDKDNRPYDFIYSRYEGHILMMPNTPDGIQKLRETWSKIIQYSKKYFGY